MKSGEYNSYRLRINLSAIDFNHLEKFLCAIQANDIVIRRYTSIDGYSNPNGTEMCSVTLNSLKLCKDLANYNVQERKSYDIKMPKIDYKLLPHYLRGFIDGDGSYYYHYDEKNNRHRYSFEIVGASELMMKQIQSALMENGIKTNVYYRKSNHSIRLMSASKVEILKLIDFLYSDAHVYLDRKFKKINEIKSKAV